MPVVRAGLRDDCCDCCWRTNASTIRSGSGCSRADPLAPEKAGTSVPAPAKVAAQAITLGADQPTTFGGRIEPATAKGFLATSMAKGDLAGDYRDFGQIAAWARGIAADLTADAATST